MKIFLGTVNIAGQLFDYAKGFERLGHEVSIGTVDGVHAFNYETTNFKDLSCEVGAWTRALKSLCSGAAPNRGDLWQLTKLFHLILKHDMFVFQWPGYSLTFGSIEYPLLKLLRKPLIQICNGDDTRHWTAFLQQYGEDLSIRDDYYLNDPIDRPYNNLRQAERYADLVVSRPSHGGLAILPYLHFFYPVDIQAFAPHFPQRNIPRIVHAPSSRGVKGSDLIEDALNQLRREGVAFELELLEGAPNHKVKTALEQADVAVDQLLLADYGKFAVEAAASGCAVAVCNDPVRQHVPEGRPFCPINKENIVSQLRRLITDKAYRNNCAQECRNYAEKFHDCQTVCDKLLLALTRPGTLRHEFYNPSFYLEGFQSPIKSKMSVMCRDKIIYTKAKKTCAKIWG
jgi:hypothetical protein